MGTDGLWDVMKNSEVRNVVEEIISSTKSKEYDDSPQGEAWQKIAR